MIYAVLSDVHANLDALDRVLADATRHGAREFVCLGDIVGYGPLPRETLARIRTRCRTVLAGNHDDAVSGRGDASLFIDLAAEAVARHKAALDAEAIAWLRTLPYTARVGGAICAHGDFREPARFIYIENEADAQANFQRFPGQLAFVGHTHEPTIFLTGRSGTVYRLAPQDFVLEDGKRYIVNLGSVGYPRATGGTCVSSYVLYNTDTRTVTFRFLPFAVSSVMQRGQTPSRWGQTPSRWGQSPFHRRILLAFLLLAPILLILPFVLPHTRNTTRPGDATPSSRSPLPGDATPPSHSHLPGDATPSSRSTEPPDAASRRVSTSRPDARILKRMTLDRLGDKKSVSANLVLAKNSAPVVITLTFTGKGGQTLGQRTETVQKRFTQKTPIPKGAISVEIVLSRLDEKSPVTIHAFNPIAE